MRNFLSFLLLLIGCVKVPEGINPVKEFELERYLGRWYEIARLDHPFERGLINVFAEYSLGENGEVVVLNKGFSKKENKWKEAKGKAYFVDGNRKRGFLKVSFFGPFYGSYIIIELDKKNYTYALVCGPNKNYLWILARDKALPIETKNFLVEKARSLDFQTEKLIWVEQK
ncbi:MAG: lipocalin family protein [Acidobacteria bacterium]|nr:lipocalin family protein [Acidobacteriota bacterium]